MSYKSDAALCISGAALVGVAGVGLYGTTKTECLLDRIAELEADVFNIATVLNETRETYDLELQKQQAYITSLKRMVDKLSKTVKSNSREFKKINLFYAELENTLKATERADVQEDKKMVDQPPKKKTSSRPPKPVEDEKDSSDDDEILNSYIKRK